jgi:hypothetical protein
MNSAIKTVRGDGSSDPNRVRAIAQADTRNAFLRRCFECREHLRYLLGFVANI